MWQELFKLIVALTIISSIAAATLAMVYDTTKGPIAEQKRLKMIRSLKGVLPEFDNEIDKDATEVILGKDKRGNNKKVVFFNARSGGNLVGVAFKVVAPDGYKGDIDIMMGVGPDKKITGIEILGHLETPGLGDKIVEKTWKDEFKGKSLEASKISVKKDGGEINQFTGATISPRAVADAVRSGLELYEKEYKDG
ncbi:MAG: RnfABCDGE type electron transport complex subunit G [Nitrospirota bacterium]